MRYNGKFIILLPLLGTLIANVAMAEQGYTIGMTTRGDKTTEPIVAQRVTVESLVVGGLATTRFDIDFYNPNDRTLEGTFTLPLAPGWRLGQFELDINGKLRAAVPVPKSTGRKAFNAVKRRGIDPALIEQTAENLFTARVYPFTAKGHRRVVITLDHALLHGADGDAFEMPYTFENALKELSIKIRVVERPVDNARVEGLDGATFIAGRNESVWRYEKADARLTETVKIHLPRPVQQPLIAATDGEGMVYATFVTPAAGKKLAAKPAELCVVWDASGSAGKGDIATAKKLLTEYLAWLGNCRVTLITFNIAASQPQRFDIKNGNGDALLKAIDAIAYDGATDMNSVAWDKLPGDEVLLFCDGVQTAPHAAAQPQVKGKLHTINFGTTRNARWLQQAALTHGGQFVDLTQLSTAAAAALLHSETHRVLWWQPNGGERYACPTLLHGQGEWIFGTAKKGLQRVTIAQQVGKEKVQESTVALDQGQNVWHDADIAALLRRSYVQQEMARLRSLGRDVEAEALAQRHGVATEKTSLIVLEDVEDYAQYAIEPPAELREEYEAIITRLKRNEDSVAKERLESLVERSNEQSKWWRGEVEPPQKKKLEATRRPGMIRRLLGATSARRVASEPTSEAAALEGMAGALYGYRQVDALEATDESAVMDEIVVKGVSGSAPTRGSVAITAWDSDSPYLKVLEYADKSKQKETYYRLKREYGEVPSFYLDAGGFFERQGDKAFAFQVLSNLLEMELGSTELHRALGQALERIGRLSEAEELYRKITEDAAYEPQSFRDLALVCEAQGKLQEAVDLLYRVSTGDWEQRFNGVDLICLNELNGLLMRHGTQGLNLSAIDKRLIKQEPVDVRIVLSWSNDDTDVDLHVTLPDGEECYYGNRMTQALGKLSNDITQGYGPEEFMHRKGTKGEYLICARLFADHTQSSIVPKYVRAVCYLHYGTAEEERHELLFRIDGKGETVKIGSVRFK